MEATGNPQDSRAGYHCSTSAGARRWQRRRTSPPRLQFNIFEDKKHQIHESCAFTTPDFSGLQPYIAAAVWSVAGGLSITACRHLAWRLMKRAGGRWGRWWLNLASILLFLRCSGGQQILCLLQARCSARRRCAQVVSRLLVCCRVGSSCQRRHYPQQKKNIVPKLQYNVRSRMRMLRQHGEKKAWSIDKQKK